MDLEIFKHLPYSQRLVIDAALWNLVPLALIVVALWNVRRTTPMSSKETFSFIWFITNGAIIHIFLDGMIGWFGVSKPLYKMYCLLDRRFYERHPVVLVVCAVEIFAMGPLCLYVGRKFGQDQVETTKRDIAVIIVSVLQIMGTIFFVSHEILRNFRDVCDPRGCFTFSPSNLFFFWALFVFANIVWIVLPLKQIDEAQERLCLSAKKQNSIKEKEN